MTWLTSADLLEMFRDQTKRPTTDAAWSDARVYRYLSRGQVAVYADLMAAFPRLLMGAPHLMETTDAGLTYHSTVDDSNGTPIYPFGHAEVYVAPNGVLSRELYGTSYGSNDGGVVFEGNRVRLPRGDANPYTDSVYLRCVQMPEAISASTEPSLQPPFLRELIVWKAGELFALSGGRMDPTPYREGYASVWRGNGQLGSTGFLGMLTTQYRRSNDAALVGVKWWRAWMAASGQPDLA